jgi:hypothetical protein
LLRVEKQDLLTGMKGMKGMGKSLIPDSIHLRQGYGEHAFHIPENTIPLVFGFWLLDFGLWALDCFYPLYPLYPC